MNEFPVKLELEIKEKKMKIDDNGTTHISVEEMEAMAEKEMKKRFSKSPCYYDFDFKAGYSEGFKDGMRKMLDIAQEDLKQA